MLEEGPRGLTVDDNGNVFVCYYNPREIRVWSRNMEERSLTIHGKLEFTLGNSVL